MHDSEDSANRVRHALASTLGETGHLGLADRVVADMPPGDLHDDAATLVEAFRELKALGELSPLEQDFLLGDDSNLKRITVILLRKETKPGELLHAAANAVIERAAMLDRIKIMGTFAPIMLLQAYSNGGPTLMNMIVDGVEGYTALKTGAYSLVVSDVEMPRMDGFALTAKIRADKQLSMLPVVLVTALDSRDHRERGIDVGANAYIVKSRFDQSNLLEAIRRLVSISSIKP